MYQHVLMKLLRLASGTDYYNVSEKIPLRSHSKILQLENYTKPSLIVCTPSIQLYYYFFHNHKPHYKHGNNCYYDIPPLRHLQPQCPTTITPVSVSQPTTVLVKLLNITDRRRYSYWQPLNLEPLVRGGTMTACR